MYYYGARYYDPRLSMWWGVDPLAGDAPGWTPYRYAFNNPVQFIDPDGMFEDEAAAKAYAKQEGIKLRPNSLIGKLFTSGSRSNIVQESDGTFAIENRKDSTSISDLGGDLGVMKAALVTPTDLMHVNREGNALLGETFTGVLRDETEVDLSPQGGTAPGPGKFLKVGKNAKNLVDFMKGGKKAVRDRNFGINDKKFWKAWEKFKQKLPGTGREKDIKTRKEAKELYDKWQKGDGF